MAITAAQQRDITKCVVSLFDAAPGTVYMAELADFVSAGGTITQLYETLSGSNAFKTQNFGYSSGSSNLQFATQFIDTLLGNSGTSSANEALAVNFMVGLLNGGATRGAAMKTLTDALDAVAHTDVNFGAAATLLDNKIEVATHYTQTLNGSATALAELQAALDLVTADEDPNPDGLPDSPSVAAAKAQNAIVVSPTFVLTVDSPSVSEGDADTTKELNFTLTLDSAPTQALTINFQTLASGTATPGNDFVAAAGTVTFAAGQRSTTVAVTVIGDNAVETNETVTVQFSGAQLASTVIATGTIADNDVRSYAVASNVSSVDEGGTVTYTLTTGKVPTGTVLDYTISGAGITAGDLASGSLTGTLTVVGGTATLAVTVNEDLRTEGAEAMTLTIEGVGTDAGVVAAPVTINDTSIQSFLLTTAVDNLTGTEIDDTFSGASATANPGDQIHGGANTAVGDTLILTLDDGQYDGLLVDGIEHLVLRVIPGNAFDAENEAGDVDLFLTEFSGLNTVKIDRALLDETGFSVNLIDLQDQVDVIIEDTGAGLQSVDVSVDFDGQVVANGTDEINVEVSEFIGTLTMDAGVETLNIEVNDTLSTTQTDMGLVSPGAQQINISGGTDFADTTPDFQINVIDTAPGATLDSTQYEGDLGATIDTSLNVNAGDGDDTIIAPDGVSGTLNLGAGNDNLTVGDFFGGVLNAGAGSDSVSITGNVSGTLNLEGGNDDVFIFTGGDDSLSGNIDMGAGNDSLSISGDLFSATIDMGAGDDFLAMYITDDSSIASLAGAEQLSLSSFGSDNLFIFGAPLETEYSMSGTVDLTLSAATVGTDDTALINLFSVSGRIDVDAGGAVENVFIDAPFSFDSNTITLDAEDAKQVTLTGAADNFIFFEDLADAVSIDASGASGSNTFDLDDELSAGDTIIGGSGFDILQGNVNPANDGLAPTLSGVEELQLTFTASASSTLNFSLANADDVETFTISDADDGGSGDLSVSISGADAALTRVEVEDDFDGGAHDLSVSYDVPGITSTDLTISFDASDSFSLDELTTSGADSLTIVAETSATVTIDDLITDASNLSLQADFASHLFIDAVGSTDSPVALDALNATLDAFASVTVDNLFASDIGTIDASMGFSSSLSLDITLSTTFSDNNNVLGNMNIGAVGGINVAAGAEGDIDLGIFYFGFDGDTLGNLTVGDINISASDSSTIDLTITANVDTGSSLGNTTIGDITLSAGNDSDISLSISHDGDLSSDLGTLTVGDVTITVGDDTVVTGGPDIDVFITANVGSGTSLDDSTLGAMTVGDITLTVGDGGNSDISLSVSYTGDINSTLGAFTVGNVSITVGDSTTGELDVDIIGTVSTSSTLGAMTVGDITLALGNDANDDFSLDVHYSGDANSTLGALTIGNVNVTIGDDFRDDADVDIDASVGSGSTLGNMTVGDVTVSVGNSASDSVTVDIGYTGGANSVLGALTVGDITVTVGDDLTDSLDVDVRANVGTSSTLGDVTVGDITVTLGDDATSTNDVEIDVRTVNRNIPGVTIGDVSLTGGDSSDLSLDVSVSITGDNESDIGNVSFGDISMSVGSGTDATGDISVDIFSGDRLGTITIGAIDLAAGEDSTLSADFQFGDPSSSANSQDDIGATTIGDITVLAGVNATITLDMTWSATAEIDSIEIGAITLEALTTETVSGDVNSNGTVYFDVQVGDDEDNVDIDDVTLGNITITMGEQATISLTVDVSNTDENLGDFTAGNIVIDAANDTYVSVDLEVDHNDSGSVGSFTVGDITVAATDNAAGDIVLQHFGNGTNDDFGAMTVGDMSFTLTDASSWTVDITNSNTQATTSNTASLTNLTVGNITVTGANDVSLSIDIDNSATATSSDGGFLSVGDINIDLSGVDSDFNGFSSGSHDVDIFIENSGSDDVGPLTVGDINVTTDVTTSNVDFRYEVRISISSDGGGPDDDLTVGDITLSGVGSVYFTFNGGGGSETVGNVDASGLFSDLDLDLSVFDSSGGTLRMGAGDDTLIGTASAETITGATGIDIMTGGGGADRFVFAQGASTRGTAAGTVDQITDFTGGAVFDAGDDILDLFLAGSVANYAESEADAMTYAAFLAAADGALDGTTRYYFGVVGADGFLATSFNSLTGVADEVIQLTGVVTFDESFIV